MSFTVIYKSTNKPTVRTYGRTSDRLFTTIQLDFVKNHVEVYKNVEWYSVIEVETGKVIATDRVVALPAKPAKKAKPVDIHAKSNEAIAKAVAKHPELRPTPEQVARWEGKQAEPTAVELVTEFVRLLNAKHSTEFVIAPGKKYDKIVERTSNGQNMVHAFFEPATKKLIKASGWKAIQRDANGKPSYRYTIDSFAECERVAELSVTSNGWYLYAN